MVETVQVTPSGLGYTLKFSGPNREHDALLAMLRYVGIRRYKLLARELRANKWTVEYFAFVCSFVGVQGFPVLVFFNRYSIR